MYYQLAVLLAALIGINPVYSQKNDLLVASIDGGEEAAREIAKKFRIHYIDQVQPGLDYYHFSVAPRHAGGQPVSSSSLFLDKRVKQVFPQQRKLRVIKNHDFNPWPQSALVSQSNETFWRKKYSSNYRNRRMKFNDPYFPKQWYLANKWLNVFAAWSKGFTGKGITATILDDGIHYLNEDLQPNYEPGVSYDISDIKNKDDDPSPDLSDPKRNSHGTYCAAILSAAANNQYCGVGVAYESKIGGVRLLDGKHSMLTDLQEALALGVGYIFQSDIVVSSWGPTDDGKTIDKPGPLAEKIIEDGVLKGRNGKGAIFVWAVGNGGVKDNCNLDGYVSSIYTISVNAVTKSGFSCLYDEPCSASLASVYVGGKHQKHDQVPQNENMVVPQINGGCISTFQGTSAAAPLAAGIIALILQANNDLTWRDVQHIIIHSGRKPGDMHGWKINGAGLPYHHYFGFGVMDALRAVNLASGWEGAPQHCNFTIPVLQSSENVLPGVNSVFRVNAELPDQSNDTSFRTEHVQLHLTLQHKERGKLEIFLVSPSGTKSQLLTRRPLDLGHTGFHGWSFVSVHFWDENPNGIWKIIISSSSNESGLLKNASITFYGAYYT